MGVRWKLFGDIMIKEKITEFIWGKRCKKCNDGYFNIYAIKYTACGNCGYKVPR